jgi:hypothetical protein
MSFTDDYGIPSPTDTPAVVWFILIGCIILLVVMAKVFADVTVTAGIGK